MSPPVPQSSPSESSIPLSSIARQSPDPSIVNRPILLLASASPRRAQLLTAAGVAFEVAAADVDETPLGDESPKTYVRRLAEAKARAVAASHPGRMVLGADTTVTVGGRILGKAGSEEEARTILRQLGGHAHEVHTGVALLGNGTSAVAVATSRVWIAPMTPADVDGYVASGEWRDKAGAYAIQGRMSRFVTRLDGSYTNVVGLPIALVWDLLMRYPDGRGAGRSQP